MARPRRHINWYVTTRGGWWWVPSLRTWHRMDDGSVRHRKRSTHANARTAKAAFRIAHRCPADEVRVVARIHRRSRKWPRGYEKAWVIDNRQGRRG
jgi:hypothetical protein